MEAYINDYKTNPEHVKIRLVSVEDSSTEMDALLAVKEHIKVRVTVQLHAYEISTISLYQGETSSYQRNFCTK